MAYEIGRRNVFAQTDVVGEALVQAYDEALNWLDEQAWSPSKQAAGQAPGPELVD